MVEVVKSWVWAEFVRFCQFLGSMLFVLLMAGAALVLFGVALNGHWIIAPIIFIPWLYIFERVEGRL